MYKRSQGTFLFKMDQLLALGSGLRQNGVVESQAALVRFATGSGIVQPSMQVTGGEVGLLSTLRTLLSTYTILIRIKGITIYCRLQYILIYSTTLIRHKVKRIFILNIDCNRSGSDLTRRKSFIFYCYRKRILISFFRVIYRQMASLSFRAFTLTLQLGFMCSLQEIQTCQMWWHCQ